MKNTEFVVGDRVKVKAGKEHGGMVMDMPGSIVEISTPALAIKFDDMDEVHKWYVQAELEKSDDAAMVEKSSKKKPVAKSLNEELQQVTYVAMKPGVDLHGDMVDLETVRLAKESFNKSAQRANLFHLTMTDAFEVIESYLIPCGVTLNEHFVEKGSWLMTLQIHDPDVWEMIKSEDINGISIGAMAEVEEL